MYANDGFDYDVAVVGGGPAGLTTALYTTRLGLDTLVVDRGGGRAAMMQETHNVIGVPEHVSGNELLQTAREQVESYGATFERGLVEDVEPIDGPDSSPIDRGFRVSFGDETVDVCRVALATGFADERPDPPLPRTGRGLHYCLHCDAFMFVDEPVYVMGTGDSAAYVAMIMLNYTDDVDVLTRGEDPEWSEETAAMLEAHPVDVVREEITGMTRRDDGWLESFEFEDGTTREYTGGFPMYGSNYHDDLVESLDLDRTEDGTVAVDDAGRTSVDGVYAVGDLTPGHNQVPVAMGEGANAGIAIHMDLRPFPRSLEEIEARGDVSEGDVPAISPALRSTAVEHEGHAGAGVDRSETVADD
ncbi:NAD(P)/FAD-dependent oxidoreductase [Natrarchaeobaculum aegyptiacum]|uniref:Thioredoxin-disulfide reductase n=1 Tax=Natrarchaeobaculum aegyptiacum TaxID=745377 RepID=A0A2Z2HXL6_9EURY|nr:NAD(P)/FAD-dependent oxidoreductase [Natrarchaeobaculum aegyptiacum]ARS90975.1 thioredoxin-disulfide reductase [Natrarchaeobaculum aegyptiacum]